jgi:hypothetical protein
LQLRARRLPFEAIRLNQILKRGSSSEHSKKLSHEHTSDD